MVTVVDDLVDRCVLIIRDMIGVLITNMNAVN